MGPARQAMGSQAAAVSLAYLSQDKSLGTVLLLLLLHCQHHLQLQPKTLYLQMKHVYAKEVFRVGALGVSLELA